MSSQLVQPLESEASFRLLFENNPLPMLVYDTATLAFLAVNKAAVRHYGYSREEFLAMTIKDICPPEEIPALLAYRERGLEEEVPSGISLTVTWKQQKKDGSVIDVELTWTRISFRSRRAVLVLAHDITELKRAESRIREQASLLNLAHDAIIVLDLEDRVVFLNRGAEALYGWAPDELIGQNAAESLFANSPSFPMAKELLLSTGDWNGELRQITKAGKEITVSSRWSLVQDDTGKPKSILIINTDVTEKKGLEAQFFRSQRLESIGTLASGIAHDLNNILTPILMSIGILRASSLEPEAQTLLNTIEGSAERGAEIVKQVLTFARGVEGDRILLQPRHLVNELVKIMGQTFPRNINIQTSLPKTLGSVIGDATQVHQVLLNLCVNARDAMPNGGTLLIAAENVSFNELEASQNPGASAGPYVVLKVTDTGGGIPPELVDQIFDPFFTTKEPGKGTGLGLSTVVGIVKSHRGFVNLESQVGDGTTFTIFLPAQPDAESQREKSKPLAIPRGHGEWILVVDDEPSIREAAVVILTGHGYQAYTAEDGTDALALYFQRRSDIKVVLTDLGMDLMDGVALVRSLKRVDPGVKVIVSSGQGENDKRDVLKGLGVGTFLDKPYTANQLLAATHEVLGASGA